MNVLTATSDWGILPPQAKYEPSHAPVPVWQICPVASTAKLPRLGTFGAGGFCSCHIPIPRPQLEHPALTNQTTDKLLGSHQIDVLYLEGHISLTSTLKRPFNWLQDLNFLLNQIATGQLEYRVQSTT